MSQVSTIDIVGSHPEIPTDFIANFGSAIPIANTLEILGATVAAGILPVYTSASGNTVVTNVQIAQAIAASSALQVGLAAFNSSQFTVDANGFVSITGSGGSFIDSIATDVSGPIGPNASGDISILGFVGAAATKPIRTDGSIANTVKLIVQASVGSASSNINNAGVSSFDSGQFAVDANGFVTLTGGGEAIDSIAVQTGTSPITPTAAGLITINGAVVSAGTNPIRSNGTGANTMALEVQISQALAAADVTKIGLSNFSSADFSTSATGFVTLSTTGAGKTITGDSGGAISPVSGNWNILASSTSSGTTPIATAGSGNTLTINLQRSQAIAATDSTKVGVSTFNSGDFSVDSNGFVSIISGGFTWTDVTSATQTLVAENGYLTDRGAGVTYTLPATASIGDQIRIVGKLGLATITPNANQQIVIGSSSGTVGVTGTAVSQNAGDCIELICITAGASSVWRSANLVGTWVLT